MGRNEGHRRNYYLCLKEMGVRETARTMTDLDDYLSGQGMVMGVRRIRREGERIEMGCDVHYEEGPMVYFLSIGTIDGTLGAVTHNPRNRAATIQMQGSKFQGSISFDNQDATQIVFAVPYNDLKAMDVNGIGIMGFKGGAIIYGAENICSVLGLSPAGGYEGIMNALAESDMVVERDVRRAPGSHIDQSWQGSVSVPTGGKYKVIPVSVLLEKIRGKEPSSEPIEGLVIRARREPKG